MTGEKYIDLAKSHFNTKDEEHIRCAISRYYYGLLHYSINKLIELNSIEYDYLKIRLESPQEGKSIHSSAINAVREINPAISSELDIVRKLRVLSDYDFKQSVLSELNIRINTRKENYRKFTNTNEILTFLNEVFLKISKLKGRAVDRSPKLSADMSSLRELKKKLEKDR